MTIEIVDFPIKKGDVPISYVKLPEGTFVSSRGFYLRQNKAHLTGICSIQSQKNLSRPTLQATDLHQVGHFDLFGRLESP